MAQSSLLALGVATAVLQQLRAVLALATAPCLTFSEQIACLTTRFLSAPITPAATLDFEKDLRRLLDESGRLGERQGERYLPLASGLMVMSYLGRALERSRRAS